MKDVVRRTLIGLIPFFIAVFALLIWINTSDQKRLAEQTGSDVANASIDITLQPDGTMKAVEKWTYDFDDQPSAVEVTAGRGWSDKLRDENIIIDSVTASCDGGQTVDVPHVAFDEQWSTDSETGKEIPWFEDAWVEEAKKSRPETLFFTFKDHNRLIYVINEWKNQSCEITASYTIKNAVGVYSDKAVFDSYTPMWVTMKRKVDSATISIHLPVPSGTQAVADKNVEVLIQDRHYSGYETTVEGDTVTISMRNPSSNVGAVYVAYPAQWMDALDYAPMPYSFRDADWNTDDKDLPEYLNNLDAKVARFVGILGVIGIVLFVIYRKRYGAQFKDKYWRDVPDSRLHPVIVSRLWGWNAADQKKKDFSVILMHLADIGAIRLVENPRGDAKGEVYFEDLRTAGMPLTALDMKVCNFIFADSPAISLSDLRQKVQEGEHAITLIERDIDSEVGQIARFTRFTMPNGLKNFLIVLAVGSALAPLSVLLFDGVQTFIEKDMGVMTWLVFAAIFTVLALLDRITVKEGLVTRLFFWGGTVVLLFMTYHLASFATEKYWWKLNVFPSIAALSLLASVFFIFGIFTLRPQTHVKEVIAKSNALKRWLEDFTMLDERPPSDVKVWGHFMVYATAFGVADRTLYEINKALPAVASDSGFLALISWLKANADGVSPVHAVDAIFDEAIDTTTNTALDAVMSMAVED